MVIAAMAILALTLMLVGTALTSASLRFRTAHQSSRWAQASQAAEAGVEIAMQSANANSWIVDDWSGEPGAVGAAPVTREVTLDGNPALRNHVSTLIAVDKIDMGGNQWLRIRATGSADVLGGAISGLDAEDARLRKMSLRFDRDAGGVAAAPKSSRRIEILAGPRATRPFQHAFVSKELFDLQPNTSVDSFDSRDPNKSAMIGGNGYGFYDPAKRQQNGDIATLDSIHVWNLNLAHVWGDVRTPNGNVVGQSNVHGAVDTGFNSVIPDEISPNWLTVTQHHGAVSNTNIAIVAGTEDSPGRHKFSSINFTEAGRNIHVQNPPGETESWVELWVEGDTFIAGLSQTGIQVDRGVHCTIHFGARVDVDGSNGGYGIKNGSQLASRMVVRAYGGSSGSIQDFILKNTDFWGVVSAPWYKAKFDLPNKHVHGSFLTWQFDVSDYAQLHYDEALTDLELGTANGFSVKSWVEAVR